MKLNSKKVLKIVAVILLVMLAFTIIQPVFAADINPTTIKGDADIKVDGIQTVGNKVATVIRNFAIVIGVIMLMVIGVKYMLGSAEEKADYKEIFNAFSYRNFYCYVCCNNSIICIISN